MRFAAFFRDGVRFAVSLLRWNAFCRLDFSKRCETLPFELTFRSVPEIKRCWTHVSRQETHFTESRLGENVKHVSLKCILHRLRFEWWKTNLFCCSISHQIHLQKVCELRKLRYCHDCGNYTKWFYKRFADRIVFGHKDGIEILP